MRSPRNIPALHGRLPDLNSLLCLDPAGLPTATDRADLEKLPEMAMHTVPTHKLGGKVNGYTAHRTSSVIVFSVLRLFRMDVRWATSMVSHLLWPFSHRRHVKENVRKWFGCMLESSVLEVCRRFFSSTNTDSASRAFMHSVMDAGCSSLSALPLNLMTSVTTCQLG